MMRTAPRPGRTEGPCTLGLTLLLGRCGVLDFRRKLGDPFDLPPEPRHVLRAGIDSQGHVGGVGEQRSMQRPIVRRQVGAMGRARMKPADDSRLRVRRFKFGVGLIPARGSEDELARVLLSGGRNVAHGLRVGQRRRLRPHRARVPRQMGCVEKPRSPYSTANAAARPLRGVPGRMISAECGG